MSKRTTNLNPTWCPGCGNYAILGSIKQALDELKLEPHKVTFVYDVGCSGNMADFIYSYGFHSLHGRAVATACGVKLANHQLPVLTVIGDGGCFGEGLSHFISAARGNHDIVVLTHDNYLYSLTTGQMSPITKKGTITPSTPFGSIEEPFNQLATALVNQATFVARGFAGDIPHLAGLLKQAIDHQGFAFLDILQPCTTYNKHMTYQWYRERIYDLASVKHDSSNFSKALQRSLETEKLPIGVFYQKKALSYHQQLPNFNNTSLCQQDISRIDISPLL